MCLTILKFGTYCKFKTWKNLSTNLQGPRKICTAIEHVHISEYFNQINWLLKRILYAVQNGLQKVILQILRPTKFRKCTTTIIHVRWYSETHENDTHGKVKRVMLQFLRSTRSTKWPLHRWCTYKVILNYHGFSKSLWIGIGQFTTSFHSITIFFSLPNFLLRQMFADRKVIFYQLRT